MPLRAMGCGPGERCSEFGEGAERGGKYLSGGRGQEQAADRLAGSGKEGVYGDAGLRPESMEEAGVAGVRRGLGTDTNQVSPR